MRWDDTDCGDSGMQLAISQEKMRWDQTQWEKTQHSKSMARACCCEAPEGLPAIYGHSLCSALWAISVSILKLLPPACPGTTCIYRSFFWISANSSKKPCAGESSFRIRLRWVLVHDLHALLPWAVCILGCLQRPQRLRMAHRMGHTYVAPFGGKGSTDTLQHIIIRKKSLCWDQGKDCCFVSSHDGESTWKLMGWTSPDEPRSAPRKARSILNLNKTLRHFVLQRPEWPNP